MQFTRHTDSPANVVRSWSPSRIRIGKEWITRSVIVHPRGLVLDWPPDCVEALASEHLEAVFALEPEVVLLGTGTGLEFPAAAITDEFRRRGRLEGQGSGPTLLLNGHLDTVGVAGMSIDPFGAELRDGRLWGRGSCDMKGGVAALLAATAKLAKSARPGALIVALTADEEHASLGMEALVASGLRADAAIVCEPTSLAVMPAHKGFVWVEAAFKGRAAHGSRPDAGVDAIEHAGLYLTALGALRRRLEEREPHPLLGHGSFHAGTIDGGSAPSVYPDACRLVMERRTLPGENPTGIIEEFQAVLDGLSSVVPEIDAKLTQGLARPATEIPNDSPLVEGLLAACTGEGLDPSLVGMTAWVDAAFLNQAGTPAVCFGPGSIAQAHSADEWIDPTEIVTCAAVLERFSHQFLQGDPGDMISDAFAEAG